MNEGGKHAVAETMAGCKRHLHEDDDNETVSKSFADVSSTCDKPAMHGDGSGDGLCDDKTTEDYTVVEDVSTLCADISSGVSHMDIDVSKQTSSSTVPGTAVW